MGCAECGEEKPATEEYFYRRRGKTPGLTIRCRECRRKDEARRRSVEGYADKQRGYLLKLKFGISKEDYRRMLLGQKGACAICRSTDPRRAGVVHFAVDHDHDTGEVRGLLCHPCNTSLGLLQDSPEVILAAAAYLIKRKAA